MNVRVSCEFGQLPLCPRQARARVALIQDLVRFLEQGLRDSVGRLKVDLAPWTNQVLTRYLERMWAAPAADSLGEAEARQDATRAFEASYLATARMYREETAMPPLGGWAWSSDAPTTRTPAPVSGQGSAQAAFEMATSNAQRARMRALSLICIHEHLASCRYPAGHVSAAQKGFDAALAHFWQQKHQFEADRWRFAIVLGGPALEQVRNQLCAHLTDSTYSAVPYFTQDGHIPSRWPGELEEAFRADVRGLQAAG